MYETIAEDERFLCIHKDPGVDCHTDNGSSGVIRAVQSAYRIRLFPLHRLDKVTSGLLLLAKDRETARSMGELFSAHRIDKFYLALSAKRPRKKQGTVIGDMRRSRRGTWRLERSREKPAVTQFVSRAWSGGKRAFLLRPQSGKTHQLRVALKSLGAPILGDPLYGPRNHSQDRCYLHAMAVSFELDGERYSFWTPPRHGEHFLDPDGSEVLAAWSRPEELAWPRIPGSGQPSWTAGR